MARSAACGTQGEPYCLAHARCPVLAIPASALEQAAGHGLHGWAFRHRGLTVDQISSSVSGR
jgi:hypothetical protein